MLLVYDIGNTNIKVAIVKQNLKVLCHWVISSDSSLTQEVYCKIIKNLFDTAKIDCKKIKGSVISSVVPALIKTISSATFSLLSKTPIVINSTLYNKLPINIPLSARQEIGADLLCNALMASKLYKTPTIIVDFGTALSFTVLDGNKNIIGVSIAPGLNTAIKALSNSTAQLPIILPKMPTFALGTNTISAIQGGIMIGYEGLIKHLLKRIKKEIKLTLPIKTHDIKVLATGGDRVFFSESKKLFNKVDKDLTIKGAALFYKYATKE